MPISASDIKLVASQVMNDVDEGGGAPTANIIADGVSNSLFNDISELDRASGRVNLRKVFPHVQTDNTDTYLGANVIVADPPDDPLVAVTIFSSGSVFDRRTDARNRIEAYLNKGTTWSGYLLENHITGQRAIQIFQREGVDAPANGHTLVLVANEGLSNEYSQYVRVTRATVEVRTFTYLLNNAYQDYTAAVVTCDLSDALRYDFPGSAPNRNFTQETGKTKVRDTLVADAATYYGASPLAVAAAIGDVKVKVGSIYSQLVPSSQTETALVDLKPSADFAHVLATVPKAVSVGGSPFSQRVRIGQETRRYSYVTILTPLPAPGSVKITYRALGRTYTLTDDGAGNLTGAGSGTVSYTTGSVSVTLQALPDDRSALIFYWGQNVAYTNRAASTGFRLPEYAFDLAHRGITPGSLTVTWLSGGVTKTATANAAGVISGNATGEMNYHSGQVFLRPTAMIDPGGEFGLDYTWSEVVEELKTGLTPDGTGSVTFTTTDEPVAGTVEVEWLTTRTTSTTTGTAVQSGSTTKSSSAGSNMITVPDLLMSHLGGSSGG